MAEVLLGPIALKSNATAISNVRRIFYGRTSVNAFATVSGKFIKIVNSRGTLIPTALIPPVKSNLIKYVRSKPTSTATVGSNFHKFKTVKADLKNESTLQTFIYDRDIRESMLGYLPQYYQDFKDIRSLIVSEANEFTRLYASLDELFMQFSVDTATYSLGEWLEKTKAKFNANSTVDERRNAVKQRLAGLGTITPAVLKSVVDDFYKSEMTELPQPGIIEFKITGRRGEPDDLAEIEEAVSEVIPRHLEALFLFSYLPWSEVEEVGLTWEQAEGYTYKELEEVYLV